VSERFALRMAHGPLLELTLRVKRLKDTTL